jgi:Lon protease-like protein
MKVKVVKIERIDTPTNVWDISVQSCNVSFVANGVVVHNCRSSLSIHISPNRQACNITMRSMLNRWCPTQYQTKKQTIIAELEEQSVFIPIFVCTIVMPGMSCPLHIFEPRYRLMIRMVMDSGDARFGMCLPVDRSGGFSQIGTSCDIKSVRLLPDGRSLVSTIGGRRFHVLERSIRNGYNVARVEWFDDLPETQQVAMFTNMSPALSELITMVKTRTSTQLIPKLTHMWSTLIKQFGDMPSLTDPNPNPFSYWLGALLPMDIEQKYAFVQLRSTYERYKHLLQVLIQLDGNA